MSRLPSFPNLVLECTDDVEIIRHCHKLNSQAWSSDLLTSEQYVERESALGNTDLCTAHLKDGNNDLNKENDDNDDAIFKKYLGIRYFVLKNLELPETSKTSQIVAALETRNHVGYLIEPNSSVSIPVLNACIGGVFTPGEHRGQGYASCAITLLNKHYDDLQFTPDGRKTGKFLALKIITLYSEVREFYSKFGYVSKHVPVHHIGNLDLILSKLDESNHISQWNNASTSERFLDFEGYQDLVDLEIEETNKIVEKELLKRSNDADKKDTYIFWSNPDMNFYQWFATRDIFIGKIAHPNFVTSEKSLKFGVSLQNKEINRNSHCVWHHAWADKSLYIIKLYVENEKDIFFLFKKLIEEAKKYNLTEIHVWDADLSKEKYPEFFQIVETVVKKEHLYTENGSLSAIRSPENKDIEWLNNSKFCWF